MDLVTTVFQIMSDIYTKLSSIYVLGVRFTSLIIAGLLAIMILGVFRGQSGVR